jgi:DNA polymerase IV
VWPLPVRKLWGVGPKTEAYLKGMSVQTIGDLATIPLEAVIRHLGKSYGNYLYEASRGIDNSLLVTHWEPKSASRETTFQSDTDEWQTIARVLAELVREVVHDLRDRKYEGKSITVKIRFTNFRTQTRATTLDKPTDDLETIRKAAFSCLGRFDLREKVRLVGMRAGGLTRK